MASTPTATEEAPEQTRQHLDEEIPPEALDGARAAWPKDKVYWLWAAILGVITLAEVTTYTHEDTWGSLAIPSLILMMAVKFWIVAWFFMHLRHDSKLLTAIFYAGLVLALAVYAAFIAASGFTFDG
jgi:cytochrome c oxidase subunit IV